MAVVTSRLLAAMREQLAARQRLLHNGAAHLGWKLGMGDREGIGGHIVVGYLTSATSLVPRATDGPDAIGIGLRAVTLEIV
jgi:hypothetical protein